MNLALTDPLDRLRIAGLIEGTTLILLLGVAVPLKHLAGLPVATSVMGPIHGVAFVLYFAALIDNFSGGGWSPREMARASLVAMIPFGTFANDRWLARRRTVRR